MAKGALIEIRGLEKLSKGLIMLGKLDDVKDSILEGAEHLKDKIADYPSQKYVSIQEAGGWASEKQRIYVIAMLASGAWDSPYRRGQSGSSEDLADKWTITSIDGGLGAKVGNNVSYGPYVQDPDEQSKMMELRGWQTTDDVAKDEADQVVSLVMEGLDRAIKRI